MEQFTLGSTRDAPRSEAPQRCKILVASDHSIIRHGLKLMLNAATSHHLVDDARPMREIADAIAFHRPDVVIADVSTGTEGVNALAQLFRDQPPPARLLLVYPPCSVPGTGMFSGLRGFPGITASDDAMQLLASLDALLRDELRPSDDAAEISSDMMPLMPLVHAAPVVDGVRITPREREVIQLITQGLCNKRIARALNISLTTVRTHRQRLMSKLGLRNSVEVAQFGARAFGDGLLYRA